MSNYFGRKQEIYFEFFLYIPQKYFSKCTNARNSLCEKINSNITAFM